MGGKVMISRADFQNIKYQYGKDRDLMMCSLPAQLCMYFRKINQMV